MGGFDSEKYNSDSVNMEIMRYHYDVIVSRVLRMFVALFILNVVHVLADPKDLRLVSYTDFHLLNTTYFFHQNNLNTYEHIVFDNLNQRIIVGAKNHLVTFRTDNFALLEVIPWMAEPSHVVLCNALGNPKWECQNFIKVLLINNTDLFVCGTSAHKPSCQTRPLSNLKEITKTESGTGICPQDPQVNNSFAFSMSTGSLFTGLVIGSQATRQFIIMKAISSYSGQVRTKNSPFWLNKPQFVAMYDIDPYVYIFFRENEDTPWGKLIVSKVARICKGDKGSVFNRQEFTSFVKTRLNCSRPGEYPFYFDELQSIHHDPDRKVFTGTFTTSQNALPGSAVCEFHLNQLNVAFSGSFKKYDDGCNCWKGEHTFKQKCKPEGDTTNDDKGPNLGDLITMTLAAQPTQKQPLIEAPSERFVHVVTIQTAIKLRGNDTIVTQVYVSTLDGEIKRYMILPRHPKSYCLIETIELLPSTAGHSVKFMTYSNSTSHLIVATKDRIYWISKERCHRFNTKTLCNSAQDPHCGWSAMHQMCIHAERPNIQSCPIVKNLKRTWYGWSDWSKCSVTCGNGIQMRMLVCLDDLRRLSTSSDLRNALRCSGNNYVTRTCKIKECGDISITPWSTWMASNNLSGNSRQKRLREEEDGVKASVNDKRFRCLCEQDSVNRCAAILQVSEMKCKLKGNCSTSLRKVTEKKEGGHPLRKCTKELVEKREENTKMKKQLHETMNHKHHHHHHHHTATPTTTTPPTTIAASDADSPRSARVFVKSLNSHHEASKINLIEHHKMEQQHQQQQQNSHKQHHIQTYHHHQHQQQQQQYHGNQNSDTYKTNLLPEIEIGYRKDDLLEPKINRPRSVENHLRNSENVRYHHFSLPQNIYHLRHRTTPTTTVTTTPAPKCQTTCPTVMPVNYGIFYGYCGCRDLGLFRVCHKCTNI